MFCKAVTAQIDTTNLLNSTTEQQLENLAEAEEGESEDDSYLQQFSDLKKATLKPKYCYRIGTKSVLFSKTYAGTEPATIPAVIG